MIALTAFAQKAANAPEAALSDLAGPGDVLVIAPHPDDESLAMGGAIMAAVEAGRRVHVAILTDGSRSHPNSASHPADVLAAVRRAEVEAAVTILTGGRTSALWLGYTDMAAPDSESAFDEVARRLEPVLEGVSAIWTTWDGDPHPDHQRAFRLARHLRQTRADVIVAAFALWARVQEPMAGACDGTLRRFATGRHRERKRSAVAAHVSQMTDLIKDDPDGFTMPPDLADHFVSSDELVILS